MIEIDENQEFPIDPNDLPVLTAEQLAAIKAIEAAEDDIDDETVQKLLWI